jgi:hypothetical protein
MSVEFWKGSGDSSFFVETLPSANREREDRVLLRDVGEKVVALNILEVSFEILEVLILMVGQGTCTTGTRPMGTAVADCSALSYLQNGGLPPESSTVPRVGPQLEIGKLAD